MSPMMSKNVANIMEFYDPSLHMRRGFMLYTLSCGQTYTHPQSKLIRCFDHKVLSNIMNIRDRESQT